MTLKQRVARIAVIGIAVWLFILGVIIGMSAGEAKSDPLGCALTVVLAIDGTKGPGTSDSVDPESPLNAIADQYRSQPDTLVEHVAYLGSFVPIEPWGGQFYDVSIADGKSNVRNTLAAYEQRCNQTPFYILLGYSQGARIAGDILEEIDSDSGMTLQQRVRGELYSDPRQGVEAAYPGEVMPGITFAGPRPPYRHVVVEQHCAAGDSICGYRVGDDFVAAVADYFRWHKSYDDQLPGGR